LSIDCLELREHAMERRIGGCPASNAIFRLLMTFVDEALAVVEANDSPVLLEKIRSEASALDGEISSRWGGRTVWGRLL